jgi:hypothetical protein
MMLFMLGLLGLASSGAVLVKSRRQNAKPTMFFINDEEGKEKFIIK